MRDNATHHSPSPPQMPMKIHYCLAPGIAVKFPWSIPEFLEAECLWFERDKWMSGYFNFVKIQTRFHISKAVHWLDHEAIRLPSIVGAFRVGEW